MENSPFGAQDLGGQLTDMDTVTSEAVMLRYMHRESPNKKFKMLTTCPLLLTSHLQFAVVG